MKADIKEIEFVKQFKYLGINFDKRITPVPHLQSLKTKITKFQKMMTIIRM